MFTLSIILAGFSVLIAFVRLFSEIIVVLGYDVTGEVNDGLDFLINIPKENRIETIFEIILLFSLAILVYIFGLPFCAKLCFLCFILAYWPQRFFN